MPTKKEIERYIHLRYVLNLSADLNRMLTYKHWKKVTMQDIRNTRPLYQIIIKECGLTNEEAGEIANKYQDRIRYFEWIKTKYDRQKHYRLGEDPGQFCDWYLKQEKKQEGKCCYCGVSADTIIYLLDHQIIYERENRGRSLEIERLNPRNEYTKRNCKFACYFCNNDKSEIFTAEQYIEFAQPHNRGEYLDRLRRNHENAGHLSGQLS